MLTVSRLNLYRSLQSVALFQSRDESRQHLCGVHFEAEPDSHRLHLVATDGHTLAHAQPVSARVASAGSFWLSAAHVKALSAELKCTAKAANGITIAARDESITIGSMTFKTEAVSFPPWRQIVPSRDGRNASPLIGVNPDYLVRVGRACSLFAPEAGSVKRKRRTQAVPRARGLEVSIGDEFDPVRLDFSSPDHGDLTLIVMPMRI